MGSIVIGMIISKQEDIMMKKVIALFFVLILALSVTACGSKEDKAITAVKNATQIKISYPNSNITQLDFNGNKLADVMEKILKGNLDSYKSEWTVENSDEDDMLESKSVIFSVTAQNDGENYVAAFHFLYTEEPEYIALYYIEQNGKSQDMDQTVSLFFADYIK